MKFRRVLFFAQAEAGIRDHCVTGVQTCALPISAGSALADPQVRNRGTIGGSLANADPAADWPAVAIAVNAELELAGPAGRRHIAAKDFFVEIGRAACRGRGEISVVGVSLKKNIL